MFEKTAPLMNVFFNEEELLKRLMNNRDLINTLLNVFIEDMPEILSTLILATEENNAEKIVEEAHKLKGSAYNLTVNNIGDLAKEIEACGKEYNLGHVNTLLPILEKQLELTIDHFKAILAHD